MSGATQPFRPTVSIIINTFNRGDMLRKALTSFQWLKYNGAFEVIVVNGPSNDNTDDVLKEWENRIRSERCSIANLSVSRNIGITLARGEFVVFIDDDAYPEPEWLHQMIAPFDDPSVGAVGGVVYDNTGFSFQYEYRTATRLLNCNWSAKDSAEHLCYPCSFEFPYPPGGNSAYRRSALVEVGGFDEEFEYYGDEVDVAVRLIDAGYLIRNIAGAYIHHKSAASHIRDRQQIITNWYHIIKNKIYFSLKNGRSHTPLRDIIEDNMKFCRVWEKDVRNHIAAGRLSANSLTIFEEHSHLAWEVGLARGLSNRTLLLARDSLPLGDFLKFETIGDRDNLIIALVSQYFPPQAEGGIPTLTKELGEALASLGHIVHVITQSPDINRVDLENGVWVHRVLKRASERPPSVVALGVPQSIWDWSATAREEVRRISRYRNIAVVEAPIWDCQGIAFLIDRKWPVVTSLQSTLFFWVESHLELRGNADWMGTFGSPMLALEKEVLSHSHGIRSISASIKADIESAYGFRLDDFRTCIVPLGMSDRQAILPSRSSGRGVLDVLFVGRLERRKGIDILLSAIPTILEKHPQVRFRILGDDSLPISGSTQTYKQQYLATEGAMRWSDHVRFEGRVDEKTLFDAYRECDIFVAPSRYGSFGLVFLEAMREGKPVIGCRAGGVPEVVSDNLNGLLVEPGNVEALVQALSCLIESPSLRRTLGDEGRRIFSEKFTSRSLAHASIRLYHLAIENFSKEC